MVVPVQQLGLLQSIRVGDRQGEKRRRRARAGHGVSRGSWKESKQGGKQGDGNEKKKLFGGEKSAGIPRIGLRSRSFYVLTLYIPEDIDIYLGLACTERSP